MLKRLLLKLPIQLLIFFLLGAMASLLILNGSRVIGLAIILFGTPLVYYLYLGKPWIKSDVKFPILPFILQTTLMLVALFMCVGPFNIWKYSMAELEQAQVYSFGSEADGFMEAESAILTNYEGQFNPGEDFIWVTDSSFRMEIALNKVYDDSSHTVYAVFATENGKEELLTTDAKKVLETQPEELVVLAHKETRTLLKETINSEKEVQFVQWQSRQNINDELKQATINKMLISIALLLIICWVDQRKTMD